jgi:hypothetical protein
VLHEHFDAVTKRVIAQAIGTEDGDVELRANTLSKADGLPQVEIGMVLP